jgi:hypothetical protein
VVEAAQQERGRGFVTDPDPDQVVEQAISLHGVVRIEITGMSGKFRE